MACEFLVLLLIAILILGYGYWHASTHGAVNISLYDFSEENTYKLSTDTKIVLCSETGEVLASGKTESIDSTVNLSHSTEGSCYEAEHAATRPNSGLNLWSGRRMFSHHGVISGSPPRRPATDHGLATAPAGDTAGRRTR